MVDASVVVEALVDAGRYGAWCRELLAAGGLAAPHHLPAEVTNVLRRGAAARVDAVRRQIPALEHRLRAVYGESEAG